MKTIEFSEEMFDQIKDTGGLIKKHFHPEFLFDSKLEIGDEVKVQKYTESAEEEGSYLAGELYVEVAEFEWVHKDDFIFDFYFKLIDQPEAAL